MRARKVSLRASETKGTNYCLLDENDSTVIHIKMNTEIHKHNNVKQSLTLLYFGECRRENFPYD